MTLDIFLRGLQAAGSLMAAGLAFYIFLQVKKIRQIEWLWKANDAWNQFNGLMISSGSASLFESFVAGNVPPEHEVAKLRTIIFSYLNITYSVATARRMGLIEPKYSEAMLETHFAIMRRQRTFVMPLLDNRGYADFFKAEIFPE